MFSAQDVKELREKTGAGMMDCKKALQETNGNMEEAITWLREKGISKAAKKAERIAAEGLANILIEGNKAIVIEVNSETDFVAKNEKFQSFVNELSKELLDSNVTTMEEALNLEVNGEKISDKIVAITSTIGEKISFRRFEKLEKTDSQVFGSYTHMGGKIVALTLLEGANEKVAKDVAMHAAAMKPLYLNEQEVPTEVLEKEKSIMREQLINEGKPEDRIEQIMVGKVKKYYEERGIPVNNAEVLRVAQGCTGIKRTTGQHPGGIIVVPKGREIYEFTPVQHPADDPNSDIITTHFDYHSIDQNLLKLDILGHDDPTMIRMLFDITGIDPTKVPLDDKETMSIFSSTDALGVTPEQIKSKVGSYGVPEFGTKFVRGMLVDTKPTTFDELIRISGLSHGTDVWLGNAQSLIDEGTVTLNEAICCRDDIMIYLIKKGVPPNPAFKIMETVRKGKALKDPEKWAEYVALMKEHDVPDWYIKSCEKIKYMFPKAHAAAYVTNAFRIAWFKVHEPKAYYTAYFTIRADEFDSDIMCHGEERVKNKMKEIDLAGNGASTKDKNMYAILELVLEMYERGINFLPIDLYKSHATKFIVEEDGIRPPLNSIPGLGTVAAEGIDEAKKDGKFMSIDDMKIRSKIGKSVIELLEKIGCLKGMSQSNQMSLFG